MWRDSLGVWQRLEGKMFALACRQEFQAHSLISEFSGFRARKRTKAALAKFKKQYGKEWDVCLPISQAA